MSVKQRGFASMDRKKQREIARKGGKAAHQHGTAHEWTSEEAKLAGRKGGMATGRRGGKTADLIEYGQEPAGGGIPSPTPVDILDNILNLMVRRP